MIQEKEYAKELFRIRQEYDTRLDMTRLGMNEFVDHMPTELFEAIIRNFDVNKASAYPEVNKAYNSLSKYINQSRERILLTSGADMALKVVFDTFCKQGDTIATCAPTFAMYKIHALLHNCILREILSDKNGDFNIMDLVTLIKSETIKMVVLANPNGVTGFCFNEDDINMLLDVAHTMDVVVVLDETYADFDKIDMSSYIEKYDNLVIVRSFSKCIGMAGLRIGYILSSEYLTAMMEKYRPMMEINSLAVEAIKEICSKPAYIDNATATIRAMRDYLSKGLNNKGYFTIVKKGNFVLVDFGDKRSQNEQKLIDNKIEYKRLGYPLENYIRFTVGTRNTMDKLLAVLSHV